MSSSSKSQPSAPWSCHPFVFGCGRTPRDRLVEAFELAAAAGISAFDSAQLYRSDAQLLALAWNANETSAGNATAVRVGTKVHNAVAPGVLYALLHEMAHSHAGGSPLWRVLLQRPLPIYVWRDLEEAQRNGLVDHIGICNVSIKDLQTLNQDASVKPSIVQMECHPFLPDWDASLALINYCHDNGIHCEVHSVLLGGIGPHATSSRTDRPTLQTIADALGATMDETVRSMVHWVRRNAPTVSFCLTSSQPDHLAVLVRAVTEPLPPQPTTLDASLESLRSNVSPIRLYPFGKDSLQVLRAEASAALGSATAVDEPSAISRAFASFECVQQIAKFVQADLDAMEDLDDSEEELSPSDPWPFSTCAFSIRVTMDKQIYRRVAILVFGTENEKEWMKNLDLDDAEAVEDWLLFSYVNSCKSKLDNLMRRIRVLHDQRRQTKALKPRIDENARLKLQSGPEVGDDETDEIPDAIANPVAMPLDTATHHDLEPFFKFVRNLNGPPNCDVEFAKGAVLKGGHLDMCKQVVGPAHLGALCRAVQETLNRNTKAIQHFLVGNNLAFDQGLEALLELMDDKYGIQTWYLAGNCIDGAIFSRIVDVMQSNSTCTMLWLKRNPIAKPVVGQQDPLIGARSIARLLACNKTIQVLDVHNVALLDEGIAAIADELSSRLVSNPASPTPGLGCITQMDLSANAITKTGAVTLAAILHDHLPFLDSLFLDINRIGDEGIASVCAALGSRHAPSSTPITRLSVGSNRLTDVGLARVCAYADANPALMMLNVGCYLSSSDLGERFNRFESVAPLVALIERHPGIRLVKCEKAGLARASCDELLAAAERRGNVAVCCWQTGGSDRKWGTFVPFDEETYRRVKQPEIVDHIYSIYRNAI
ncbi:hypothetical protein DFJ73DRAFT_637721 [Zopfochytrium polystomum]|nr:hypothetical protein DFJ73DRAFT_637721 [Zopfochytrium polystomum]